MRFTWTPLLFTVINSVHSTENQVELKDGGGKENLFLVYSEPKLVRRHSRDNQDPFPQEEHGDVRVPAEPPARGHAGQPLRDAVLPLRNPGTTVLFEAVVKCIVD